MGNLILDIEQKIENILKKLALKAEVSPKEFIKKTRGEKHRYLSLCADKKDKNLIFYARLHKNPDAKKKMISEISFLKEMKQKKIEISEYVPEFYQGKKEKDFEWFTREYFITPPLGVNEQLQRKITKEDALLLARALYCIKNTSLSRFKNVPLREFPVKNYLDSQNSINFLLERKIINQNLSKKLKRVFKENAGLLKKENKYFSHGDFNLGNLMISNNNLKIVDWESVQINNSAFDVAYLFSHLWQTKTLIRKNLLKTYTNFLAKKEKVVFKKLFPLVVFYLAVGGLEAKPPEILYHLLKKRKEFFKKLLRKVGFGFEQLIEV
jgi:thiamine kinase-like enzyme